MKINFLITLFLFINFYSNAQTFENFKGDKVLTVDNTNFKVIGNAEFTNKNVKIEGDTIFFDASKKTLLVSSSSNYILMTQNPTEKKSKVINFYLSSLTYLIENNSVEYPKGINTVLKENSEFEISIYLNDQQSDKKQKKADLLEYSATSVTFQSNNQEMHLDGNVLYQNNDIIISSDNLICNLKDQTITIKASDVTPTVLINRSQKFKVDNKLKITTLQENQLILKEDCLYDINSKELLSK